jgi:hypothetical protein
VKLCKNYLEADRDSEFLWDCHARLERLRGRSAQALKVYEFATSQFTTTGGYNPRLWWSFAEMEWLRGERERCISVICRFAKSHTSPSYTSLDVLRAKSFLDEHIGSGHLYFIRLRALLELLTGTVDGMFHVTESWMAKLDPSLGERIQSLSLEILYHHTSTLRQPCSRRFIRQKVWRAVTMFPNNTLLLSFLLEAERGEGIWGRVRGMIGSGHGLRSTESDQEIAQGISPVSFGRKVWELWVVSGWLGRGGVANEAPMLRRLFQECEVDP